MSKLFEVHAVLRKNVAFMLCGTAQGGKPYTTQRTSIEHLFDAIHNYQTNPYLAPTGKLVRVYLWKQDKHLAAELDYGDLEVEVVAMEDYARDYYRRASAFEAGYRELVRSTGMRLSINCHDVSLTLVDGGDAKHEAPVVLKVDA